MFDSSACEPLLLFCVSLYSIKIIISFFFNRLFTAIIDCATCGLRFHSHAHDRFILLLRSSPRIFEQKEECSQSTEISEDKKCVRAFYHFIFMIYNCYQPPLFSSVLGAVDWLITQSRRFRDHPNNGCHEDCFLHTSTRK